MTLSESATYGQERVCSVSLFEYNNRMTRNIPLPVNEMCRRRKISLGIVLRVVVMGNRLSTSKNVHNQNIPKVLKREYLLLTFCTEVLI